MRVKVWRVYSGVFIILLGCRVEDVYDGCLTYFYGCECADVYSYVDLYKDVDIFGGHEAVFCVVRSGACVRYKRETQFFCIVELYGVVCYRCRNTQSFLI